MGDESLVGIVDLVSGEKDPRNLMVVFSLLKVVMVEWDISNHVEVREPVPLRIESNLTVPGLVRFCVSVLSDHIPSSAKRPLRHHCSRLERSTAELHIGHERLCSPCHPGVAGQAGFYFSQCQGKSISVQRPDNIVSDLGFSETLSTL